MHQLILGSDISLRDSILSELKTRFLKSSDAIKLDFASLEAKDLSLNDLKAAIMTVPAIAQRRIILISRCEKLNDDHLQLIDQALDGKDQRYVIVLEAGGWDKRSALRKKIAEKVRVSGGGDKEKNAFDLLKRFSGNPAGVLAQLPRLLEAESAENVLGAVRWWWSHEMKRNVPSAGYKKGLLVIQQADERIKLSSLLSREQAVEVLLVKLSLLARS